MLRSLLCWLGFHSFPRAVDVRTCRHCTHTEWLADEGGGHDGPLWLPLVHHHDEKPEGGEYVRLP